MTYVALNSAGRSTQKVKLMYLNKKYHNLKILNYKTLSDPSELAEPRDQRQS